MASPDRQPPSARLVRIGVVLALLLVAVGVALAVLQPGDLGGDAASGESPPATDAPKDPPVAGSDTTVAAAPGPTTTVTPAPAPSSTGSVTTAAPPSTARPAPTAPGAAPTPTTGGAMPPTATPGDPSAGGAGTEAAMALTGGGSLLVPGVLLAGVAAALHRTRRTV